ncbi:hypothetical protein KSP39_PZI003791 [Platanthera zijinensis]|uniref:Uncharacterized protein n=1 Tax=Platanthera zijinensis TaxID=2320716 RepID=A0AAP0BY06_9ASPA
MRGEMIEFSLPVFRKLFNFRAKGGSVFLSGQSVKTLIINLPPDAWIPTGFLPIDTPALNLDEIIGDDPRPSADNSAATAIEAPEKKLTLFALRLAILEKAASGIGALGFIWATVVLLGGFATSLQRKDFWFVTVILLVEGARIFSRSHELKWRHQATWTLVEAGTVSFRALHSSSRRAARRFRSLLAARASVVQMTVASSVSKNDLMRLNCQEVQIQESDRKDMRTTSSVRADLSNPATRPEPRPRLRRSAGLCT